ncbi:hypothetical protein ACFL5Z_08235 [Planctomycetota bacterium]
MSPRKNNVITVKGWPDPKKGKLYKGVVRKAVKKKTENVHVTIENLDPTQLGRIHEIDLPLPPRPSQYHRTCSFLMACGIDATIDGVSIDLNEIAGITVGMRFGAVAQDGPQQIDFERIENPSTVQVNTPDDNTDGAQDSDNMFKSEAEGEREF